jgi:hypothetical protein
VVGLVEHRQVEFEQVSLFDIEAAVLARGLEEPVGDRTADAAGTGAGDDYKQFRI